MSQARALALVMPLEHALPGDWDLPVSVLASQGWQSCGFESGFYLRETGSPISSLLTCGNKVWLITS